jgi:hypothetical protein
LKLHRFDRTRTNIETNQILFAAAFFEHDSIYSLPQRESGVCAVHANERALSLLSITELSRFWFAFAWIVARFSRLWSSGCFRTLPEKGV